MKQDIHTGNRFATQPVRSTAALRVLHLEDNVLDAELVRSTVESEGYACEVVRADDRQSFLNALKRGPFDVILADHTLPSFDGVAALRIAKDTFLETPFIFVSGTIGEDLAIDCLKAGATDYVLKQRLGRLVPSIRRALIEAKERSERKAAEESLRKQAQLLDLANDSIVVRDLDERISYWNRGAERLFGWRSEEAIGRVMHELVLTEFPRAIDEIRQSFMKNGHWEGEVIRRTKEGRVISVESRWTLQRDRDGMPTSTLEISNDVTERRRLESQFLQAQKMESVGRLASGVAHDFNNLLTVIIGRSYLLMSRMDEDESARKDLDLIQKTAERAAILTRQLLAFSRKQTVAPRLLDVNALIANMDRMLRRLIGEDIEVFSKLGDNLGAVKADPGQIEQVIMNLVVNARDAMPNGGKLTLETANIDLDAKYVWLHAPMSVGPHVMIAISDTGHGMDDVTKDHIFEPFFTTKENGTGLGLSTVYGIIKQSNGNIRVYSEPNVGTTFKVYFPRIDEPGETLQAGEGQQVTGGTETILLVEDEEAVREIVRETLSGQGYVVIEARHGPEALLVAEKYPGTIHLLLTDVVMPAMSGPELAVALTKSHPETKALFMSGYTDYVAIRQGLIEEGSNFLQKPFTQADLARRVRDLLDSESGRKT